MKLDLLKDRLRVGVVTGGTFSVIYHGPRYARWCVSNNTLAHDRLRCDVPYKSRVHGYTYRQALQALYNECHK